MKVTKDIYTAVKATKNMMYIQSLTNSAYHALRTLDATHSEFFTKEEFELLNAAREMLSKKEFNVEAYLNALPNEA